MGAAQIVALVKGLANTVDANGIFVIVVGDVAFLAVLAVVIFVALSLPSRSPNACMVMRPIPSPLHHARVFLVGCCVTKY